MARANAMGSRSPKSSTLPERVAQTYYAHGLLCASYPKTVIAIAAIVALICCYPLVNLPLSGNPTITWSNGSIPTTNEPAPKFYIQQVILRTAVIPWNAAMGVGDAFRAPLYESFKLLDIVRNYQDPVSMKTLGHVCLHVESIKRSKKYKFDVLPEYSCLVLSPANFWKQDVQQFSQDSSILSTIYNYQNLQKGRTSVAEMLFGMHLVDTGIKRYPLRNRQRVLQYAVTLFFGEHDEQFINGLRSKLNHLYPLHKGNNSSEIESKEETILIHYPGQISYYEYIPIMITYLLLFVYYYFSVRKIELISSRVGMAVTVLITVLSSLFMTLGVSFFFGLTLSVHNRQVFPYLVILVGLENVLVLTKSVVSTPTHLDIKIRVAQGLSKEGWSITKNLMIEITILTIGLFTFVPAIQEICIFSIVGLISDFFLQMFFFSTILGIDTQKLESTEKNMRNNFRNTLYQTQTYEKTSNMSHQGVGTMGVGLNRSKSHPRLNTIPANIVAGGQTKSKIPKRLRLVNIWARTRFFQRAFMILMVVWIGMILYNSGIVEQYFSDLNVARKSANKTADDKQTYNLLPILNSNEKYMINFVTEKSMLNYHNNTDDINRLKHTEYKPWLSLSTDHWTSILRKYNISTSGGYVAILPSIQISHIVAPEQAVVLRNPEEKYGKFEWQALALALDPIDFSESVGGIPAHYSQNDRPFYPTSPMEIFLTAILCLISVIVLAYTVFVLYKCICSRNYAEWRASWASDKSDNESEVPVLLEAVPVVMDGHKQEIECLASDGRSIASTCLGGNLKIWDSITGELVAAIDRYSPGSKTNALLMQQDDEDNLSDYESGSPPSRDEDVVAFLKKRINTKFVNLRMQDVDKTKDFDFGQEYKQISSATNATNLRNRNAGLESNDWISTESTSGCDFVYEGHEQSNAIDIMNTSALPRKDSNNSYGSNNSNSFVGSPARSGAVEPIAQCEKVPSIWCMDFVDNLVVIGCSDGRLEFWEGTTSKFKCMCEDTTGSGVTNVKIVGSRVVAARIYGTLDFFQLQTFNQGRPIDWNFTCAYRRTHVRTGSAGSISDFSHHTHPDSKEDLKCIKVLSTKAHQQPITALDCEGGRVLTGSQDHTLKVFRIEDGSHLYTLHGHYGPISCLFIDRISPATSGSGSQDGMLCVWDLLTGACMYSIQAHDGSIMSLTYSASYVISLGVDERICVWERFQGHLLNTLQVNGTFTCQVLMLTPHLVITARSGGLALWDVRRGENVKSIVLGHSPYVFVKQLVVLRDAVLCDFGSQLRIVRFPLITHKYD